MGDNVGASRFLDLDLTPLGGKLAKSKDGKLSQNCPPSTLYFSQKFPHHPSPCSGEEANAALITHALAIAREAWEKELQEGGTCVRSLAPAVAARSDIRRSVNNYSKRERDRIADLEVTGMLSFIIFVHITFPSYK